MKSAIYRCSPRRLFLALSALFALPLGAQTNPDEPEAEERVTMSPFIVTVTADTGYEANRSLSGTGLNTKLTDLGASISVVNSRFLEDTASNNLKDALVYLANMDATGFGGNISGANPVAGGTTNEPTLTNTDSGTARVRGLATAEMARNYFRTIIPMDRYNTERVEVNRGANALFFGVGSPAGIVNTYTTGAATQRSFGSAEISLGSYASTRTSFNYNQVLLKNALAIRIAALRDDQGYQQESTYTDTRRAYVAGEWDIKPLRNHGIFTSTTLRANFEMGKIKSNKPRVLTPVDGLSSWFEATLPDVFKELGVGRRTYDPVTGTATGPSGGLLNAAITNAPGRSMGPNFFFQDVWATAPRDNVPVNAAGQTVLGRPTLTYFLPVPPPSTKVITGNTYASMNTRQMRQNAGLPDADYFTADTLTDPTIFNFFDYNIAGPNQEGISNLKSVNCTLEQLLFDGKAGMELSYNRENWDESRQSLISSSTPTISIDVNTRIWTGEDNPNFGRPYIAGSSSAVYNEQEIDTRRAKLFYELDLEKILQNRIGAILGRQVFSVLAQRETLTTENHSGGVAHYTPDYWPNGTNQSRADSTYGKRIVAWIYLGPSLYSVNTPSGANLSSLRQNLMNFQDEVNGRGVLVQRLVPPSSSVARQDIYKPYYDSMTLLREDREASHTSTSASLNQRTLDSQGFIMQSNWLKGHVASTIGWRKEDLSTIGVNAPIVSGGEAYALIDDPSFSLYNPTLEPQAYSQTLFAWSVVAKAPASWLKRIPAISAINVYYGTSENFTPSTGKAFDPLGEALGPPSGKTKERGIYFEAFGGRISARLNFFETTQIGSLNSTVGGLAATIVSLHTQVYNAVRSGYTPNGGNGFPVGYVPPPQQLLDLFQWQVQSGTPSSINPGVTDTSDLVAKGGELEVMFRPTRGLSFIMNVSKQESVRSNTGEATRILLLEMPTASGEPLAVEWLSDWARLPLNATIAGGTRYLTDELDTGVLRNAFARSVLSKYYTAKAADGTAVSELRKWRANFVGSYQFQNGRLKGFGVGAGVRWLDKVGIGYPLVTADVPGSTQTIRISDVQHPFYGPTETRYDAWVSYQTKIFNGKVGLRIQLNGRNLLTQNELVPVHKNPDGAPAVWSIAEGRKFTLSARFSF
jgi:outer membrane receptor protein involved in Fe transport